VKEKIAENTRSNLPEASILQDITMAILKS
jgi:hypothetical protein